MGSLLIVESGQVVTTLPRGVPCPKDAGDGNGGEPDTVVVDSFAFTPSTLTVAPGTEVTFDFQEANHTVKTTGVTGAAAAITINNGGGDLDPVPAGDQRTVTITGNPGDQVDYECGIHGAGMPGTIQII